MALWLAKINISIGRPSLNKAADAFQRRTSNLKACCVLVTEQGNPGRISKSDPEPPVLLVMFTPQRPAMPPSPLYLCRDIGGNEHWVNVVAWGPPVRVLSISCHRGSKDLVQAA